MVTRGLLLTLIVVASSAHASPPTAAMRTLLGEEKMNVVAAGRLFVVEVTREDGHAVYLVDHDQKRMVLVEGIGILDGKRTLVRPFLDAPHLIEVRLVGLDDPQNPTLLDMVVRDTPTEFLNVCSLDGLINAPPLGPQMTTTVTRARGTNLTFRIVTHTKGQPPTSARYLIEDASQGCTALLETGAPEVPDAIERVIDGNAKAHGFADPVILNIVDDAHYLVSAKRDDKELMLLVDKAHAPIVVMEGGLMYNNGGLHSALGPFLGERRYRDLQITTSWSNGMGGHTSTMHYVLRAKSDGSFERACRFGGDASGGMEDVSSSTRTKIVKLGDKPLRFAIEAQSSGSSRMNMQVGNGGGDRPTTTECTVPATGECECPQL